MVAAIATPSAFKASLLKTLDAMNKKKTLGWCLIMVALVILVVGDSVPSIMSLFYTLAAMLIGGVGMYLAFGDQP
jgi:hypothetical protein